MMGPPAHAGASSPALDEVLLPAGNPLTIEQSARLISAWGWAEVRLYQVIGGWVTSTSRPATKIYFDSCSQHHAWRARMWEERRPGLPAHLLPSFGQSWPAIDRLATVAGDVERLSAYCRVVLPRAVVGYRSWQRLCSPTSDQPVARALGFAVADTLTDWERGCGLLQGYLAGEGAGQAAVAAAGATAEIDQLMAEHGWWPSSGSARLISQNGPQA
jgi:hypothetical protein